MKQKPEAAMQLYWLTLFLLLISGLIHLSIAGSIKDTGKCDSDGIVGTFNISDEDGRESLDSLTITPVNFTGPLTVSIAREEAPADSGITFYLTLDGESLCAPDMWKYSFKIGACMFGIEAVFNKSVKLTVDNVVHEGDLGSYDDPYQGSYYLNGKKITVSDPTGGSTTGELATDCSLKHDGAQRYTFDMVFDSEATRDDNECGIQLEFKGVYIATEMKVAAEKCALELPGESGGSPDRLVSTAPSTTQPTPSFPWWIIVVGALLVLAILIGVIVYFCVIVPKRKAAPEEEDIEGAPEEIPEEQPEEEVSEEEPVEEDDEAPGSDVKKPGAPDDDDQEAEDSKQETDKS